MKNYEILYKRTSTGATQQWNMEREGNKYRTISGQLGGKLVTSEWSTCAGKNIGRSNETSPEAQAASEVESAYTLKRKKGYTDTPEMAQASEKFSPMLAKKFEDYADKLEYPVYCQPKLDGIRCIARIDGLWSRTGNRILACPHIEEALRPAFEQDPDLVLDGELYNHALKDDFNTIVSAVKKQKPTTKDLETSKNLVQYWIYDSPGPGDLLSRINSIETTLAVTGYPDCLVKVPTKQVLSPKILDTYYEEFLNSGYEGQIVRTYDEYEQKRSKHLLKRKEWQDAEFTVLAIEEGQGNRSNRAGYAVLDLGGGKTSKANIKGTMEFLQKLLENREHYVGKKATCEFFAYTPDGSLRFPRIKSFHAEERW